MNINKVLTVELKAFTLLITHHVVSTLCASQHQSRVRHVIAQVNMCSSTQNTSSFLQRDVSFNGNGICSDHWAVGSTLALDFTTLCITG